MFEFNGKNVKFEIDYNGICELEEMGISLTDLDRFPLKSIRALLYISLKRDNKELTIAKVGDELMTYIKNGGSLETIGGALTSALNDSGFFPKDNK